MNASENRPTVAIVGAGPIGIELHVALQHAGCTVVHYDAGAIGHTVTWYPRGVRFFSSPERIRIAGVPLAVDHEEKATREEYLAYLRGVVDQFRLPIRTFERVTGIESAPSGGFVLWSEGAAGERSQPADRVVIAMGDMHRPRRIEVPGEELPHVHHYFDEPHRFHGRRLVIVGGKNSAVEAALRCLRVGAHVTISYRRAEFREKSVKAWLLPDIRNQIAAGRIGFESETVPVEITPTEMTLAPVSGDGARTTLPADDVLLMTGYEQDPSLFRAVGVELSGEDRAPTFDPETMETNVTGVFVAGTAAAGTQSSYQLFIENCHPHVKRISRAIAGVDPPFETDDTSKVARGLPES
ncbi:MAG: NAD(P)-binding domain-containing protein [Planctomycetota bacterium]